MNLKYLFFTLSCFSASSAMLAQGTHPPANAESLYDVLRERFYEYEVYWDDPPVDVLFFDIDGDGVPDALATLQIDRHAGGCHGNDWDLYQFKDGERRASPYKMLDEYTVDPSSDVFARGDDFYSLAVDGQKPKLVLIYTSYGKTDEGNGVWRDAREITIDAKGYIETIPIPELTWHYVYGSDGHEDPPGQEPPSQERLAMAKRLTPLSIESFLPQKDIRGGTAIIADTEETEGQPVAAGDKTPDTFD